MVTYPGKLHYGSSSGATTYTYSNLCHGLHHACLRHRNRSPILQVRTLCAARKVEYDIVHLCGSFLPPLDLGSDYRMAYVQHMLRQLDLVPDALRPPHSGPPHHIGLFTAIVGRYHQHPAHANR